MANIKINGTALTVPDGKNLLECALDAGIYIPHLCHHKDLSPMGSCRMCIVEVEGEKDVQPSCMLQARDGLSVSTDSERLRQLRMLALELLLCAHPEDCSTCPKYGSCELQTLIQYIGPKTGRLKMRTKGFRPTEGNPLIIHDMNRCVLCGRCVRACSELRGVKVLQFQKKELESYVGTLQDRLLKDADCRFCGACAEVCPTGTIRDILRPEQADWKREERIVPCRTSCPIHTDIPEYIRFVREGNCDAAAALIREKSPFPKVLGCICTHACELACKRGEVNEAMSIRNIKRYAAEHDTGKYWRGKGKHLPATGKKVCVVGAGPAGLTAAYYLQKQGHQVTVLEAMPAPGGMLAYGIPAYRLPREIIAEEIGVIRDEGVEVRCGERVKKPLELKKDYDAVLLTVGGHKGVRLPMEGANLPGVLLNTDFLRQASLQQKTGMGGRVIVLGGGNVAFDCARTAKRLGAQEIHLACLEARGKMTADDEEIEQAKEEGIFVHPAQTFERITGTEQVTGVDFMNVQSFTFDENRRAVIQKEPGSEHHIDADTVIFAVGQRPDLAEDCGLKLGRGNCIAVAAGTAATDEPGVFAAGDAVYGTKSVVMAIAAGREAASEIDRFLGGDGDISEKLAPAQHKEDYIGQCPGFGYAPRKESTVDGAAAREDNFKRFDHGICSADIGCETARCLQCDLRLKISAPRLWGDFMDGTGGVQE